MARAGTRMRARHVAARCVPRPVRWRAAPGRTLFKAQARSVSAWRLSARATAAAGFAGLRIVAQTASTSLPEARGVLILLVWFCAIFMLAGLQKFAGKTGLRCALCEDEACTVAQLGSVVAPELPCGFAADARRCEAPLVCLPARDNPLSDWTSFNDFRWASLSVLRVALAGVRTTRPPACLHCLLTPFARGRDGGRCCQSWLRAAGAGPQWRFACLSWWAQDICWSRCLRRCSRTCLALHGELMPRELRRSTLHSRCAANCADCTAHADFVRLAPRQVTLRRKLSTLGIWCCVFLRMQHPDALVHHRHHSHEASKAVEPPRPGQFLLAVERALLSQQLPFVLAACHIINIVAMTVASAGMTEEARAGTHYVNLIITVVFALKTAGQLAVLGVVGFGASWSRVLEGIVTLISLVRPRLDRF